MSLKTKLKLLDTAIAPPAKKIEPPVTPPPGLTLKASLVRALLKFAKLPTEADRDKLDKLAIQWRAELSARDGFSRQDAKVEWLGQLQAVRDGKRDPRKAPSQSRAEITAKHLEVRALCRHRAALVSQTAQRLAADVLEESKKHIPAFQELLLAQEKAILPDPAMNLAESPLQTLCGKLAPYIDARITKLRGTTPVNRDPSFLL